MKEKSRMAASVLSLLLALFLILRIMAIKNDFEATVRESHATTEGYDQKFINIVRTLEIILADRASFGYPGGKDPMTGVNRQVAQMPAAFHAAPAGAGAAGAGASHPGPSDQVRLTAIISDGKGKKITAVIMDGERSYTVDSGDVVGDRKILRITSNGIWMGNESQLFFYDIRGKKQTWSWADAPQSQDPGLKKPVEGIVSPK